MILLLNVWTHGSMVDEPEWALVSLNNDMIQTYLNRIALAQSIADANAPLPTFFDHIRYWDGKPVWIEYCEIWEELYTNSVQIVEHLQAGEHGLPLATSCTMLLVTSEGISWETTLKNSPGVSGTDVVTKTVLLELKLRQNMVTGQCQRYPERP